MKDRPFEFRTSVVVGTLLGLVMALLSTLWCSARGRSTG